MNDADKWEEYDGWVTRDDPFAREPREDELRRLEETLEGMRRWFEETVKP